MPLLRHSKSFGPSAPIAYATSVSPPDEAIAWPGRGYQMGNKAVAWLGFRCLVLDDAVSSQGRRCWVANDAAGCPWHSSCKSPRTLQKCKLLITKQLTFGAVLGEHKLSLPSTRLKVNHLCIRCLCFESVRGELQESHFYASRCNLSLFASTKMPILCSKGLKMGVPKPKSAQKPRFCARENWNWHQEERKLASRSAK